MTDLQALTRLQADPAFAAIHPSLARGYDDDEHQHRLDAMYRRFVGPGDLVFDVGAHVGDRVSSFRRLGARVIAVEPQPLCLEALHRLHGGDSEVTIVEGVCGAEPGSTRFFVNSQNPTTSTLSADFIAAADGAGGWEHEVWDAEIDVTVTTLDVLIAAHGTPAFVKIDVEGYESTVLSGLSSRPRALSFEFTTIEREVARRCLRQLTGLGFTGFDLSLGETMTLSLGRWVSAPELAEHLQRLPHEANAGDVYCTARRAAGTLVP